jgi:peptidoglycan/LPS O-acetylase OafA/YrhL
MLLFVLYVINEGRWLWAATMLLAVSAIFVWVINTAATGYKGWIARILENPALLYIGKISYAIYLFHNFMPAIIPRVFSSVGIPYPTGDGATIKQFCILALCTVSCAALSWHLFEGPLNGLKKYYRYSDVSSSGNTYILPHIETLPNSS